MKYIITPEIDACITRVYRSISGNGEINALARQFGLPRWKVTRRAIYLGVVKPRFKEPAWSPEEINLLTRYAHLTPKIIQMKLKTKGYGRSETAIVLQRKRLRLLKNLDGMSATCLSEAFGVDIKTVTRWIEKGYLLSERRGTERTALQGGDEWYIKEKNIRKFIIQNIHIIDIRKVDKYWMVDILSEGKNN